MWSSSLRIGGVMLASLLVSACGGGGGATASMPASVDAGPIDPVPREHASATLLLKADNARHVAAHSWFTFMVMNDFAMSLPTVVQFWSPTLLPLASPDNPSVRLNCGAASIDLSYVDTDRNGRMSAGDLVRISGGCGTGNAVDGIQAEATLLAVDATGATSIRLDVTNETHTRLWPYGLRATVSGSFLVDRLPNRGLRLRSLGSISFSSGPGRTGSLSNFATEFSNRPVYGSYADMSTDMTLQSSLVPGQRVQIEVVDGPLTILGGYNEAPSAPGKLRVSGVGASRVTVNGQQDTVSFRIDMDPGASGPVETSSISDASALYSAL